MQKRKKIIAIAMAIILAVTAIIVVMTTMTTNKKQKNELPNVAYFGQALPKSKAFAENIDGKDTTTMTFWTKSYVSKATIDVAINVKDFDTAKDSIALSVNDAKAPAQIDLDRATASFVVDIPKTKDLTADTTQDLKICFVMNDNVKSNVINVKTTIKVSTVSISFDNDATIQGVTTSITITKDEIKINYSNCFDLSRILQDATKEFWLKVDATSFGSIKFDDKFYDYTGSNEILVAASQFMYVAYTNTTINSITLTQKS